MLNYGSGYTEEAVRKMTFATRNWHVEKLSTKIKAEVEAHKRAMKKPGG